MELVVEVRSLGRERKPVSYVVEEDLDGRSRKRGRKIGGGRIKDTSKSPIIIFMKHRLCPLNYIPYVSKVKKHNYCLVLQCLLTRCSSESEHRHWTG